MKYSMSSTIKACLGLLALTGCLTSILAQSEVDQISLTTQEKTRLEAGEIILRELTESSPRGQTVEVIGLIRAAGEDLVQVLTDYEAYPEFMSAVDLIEVLDQNGEESTLNYFLSPMLGFSKKYRIRIAPIKLDEGVWKIEWQMIPWPGLSPSETIRDTRGYWLIIQETEKRSLVQYYVYSDPGQIPFGLGGMVDVLGKRSIREVFMETRSQAETTLYPPTPKP